MNFDQSRKAVQAVNSWVSEATHGKIKSMFSEGRYAYTRVHPTYSGLVPPSIQQLW
jgi:serine protease inhibitor